jgi:hypothetical protein
VYDLNDSLPNLISKIILHYSDPKLEGGKITALSFEEQARLLYVAHRNNIFIYQIFDRADISSPSIWITLSLTPKSSITSLLTVDGGHFIVVGTLSGGVAVFDMRSDLPVDDASTMERWRQLEAVSETPGTPQKRLDDSESKSPDISGSTTAVRQVPWFQAIQGSNTFMKEWLRSEGVDYSGASRRMDLIRLVAGVVGATARTTAMLILPTSPRKDVIFSTKLSGAVCCACYAEDLHCVLCGCADGSIYSLSAKILSPDSFTGDTDEWGCMRHSTMSSHELPGNVVLSQRGKNHEVASRSGNGREDSTDVYINEEERTTVLGDARPLSTDIGLGEQSILADEDEDRFV